VPVTLTVERDDDSRPHEDSPGLLLAAVDARSWRYSPAQNAPLGDLIARRAHGTSSADSAIRSSSSTATEFDSEEGDDTAGAGLDLDCDLSVDADCGRWTIVGTAPDRHRGEEREGGPETRPGSRRGCLR